MFDAEQFNPTEYFIKAYPSHWWDGVEVFIVALDQRHPVRMVGRAELVWKDRGEPGTIVPPLFHLDLKASQELMDDLWASGVRPTEGRGSAGAMKAVQEHLLDMRTIAFDKLKVEQPK
jgi:hypothetical protein